MEDRKRTRSSSSTTSLLSLAGPYVGEGRFGLHLEAPHAQSQSQVRSGPIRLPTLEGLLRSWHACSGDNATLWRWEAVVLCS